MMLSKDYCCRVVKGVLLLTFLTFSGWVYAQTSFSNRDTPYLSLDGGAGTSDVLVDGLSFGFLLNPTLSITPDIMLGNKNVVHVSTDNIIALETQGFFRWNFLRLGSSRNTTNIFIQGGIGFLGAFRRFNDEDDEYDGKFNVKNSRASLLADATLGVTIPLSSRWHIEPSIRGGYPFMGGAAITVGYKFPLSRRIVIHEHEYVEVIRTLPPSEIVRRILINQVEYILFAPDISSFNYHLDHDAQSLNELVIEHASRLLKENPDFRVRIEGHANPVTNIPGEIEELIALSEARAEEVARLLREKGVEEEQIVIIAYGGARVVAGASDHDHWNMNRRVELIIIQVDAN